MLVILLTVSLRNPTFTTLVTKYLYKMLLCSQVPVMNVNGYHISQTITMLMLIECQKLTKCEIK